MSTAPSIPSAPATNGAPGLPAGSARTQELANPPDRHRDSNDARSAPAGPGGASDQPAGSGTIAGRPEELLPGDEAPQGEPGTGENVCPQCGGSGRAGATACPTCGGSGKVTTILGGA